MLNAECFESLPPLSSSSPQNIQHIQHIRHLCSFKHILIHHAPPQNSTYSTFPLKKAHFVQNVPLSAEMLNMLNSGGGMLNQNVLNIAEMSNMLNMLNLLGRARR